MNDDRLNSHTQQWWGTELVDLYNRINKLQYKLECAQDAIVSLTTTRGAIDPEEIYIKRSVLPDDEHFVNRMHYDWQAIYDAHKNRGSIE